MEIWFCIWDDLANPKNRLNLVQNPLSTRVSCIMRSANYKKSAFMKIKTKEIIWPIGILIISFILFNPSLKIDNFTKESNVDINIHDTYFVVYNRLFLFSTITIL